jgi:hypothetical protein
MKSIVWSMRPASWFRIALGIQPLKAVVQKKDRAIWRESPNVEPVANPRT